MEKTNFDRLLHRYLTGQVTEDERIKLEAWLEVMKTEDTPDLELSKADEDKLFQKITNHTTAVKEVKALHTEFTRRRPLFANRWFQVAASVVFISLASYTIWHSLDSRQQAREMTAVTGMEKIILNDGTLVWLQPGSSLSYYQKTGGGRHAELSGEALFEVAKDASHPFTIACGPVTVRVLGTSFNVKTGSESIELKVLTGKVNLSSENDQIGVDVAPNEKVVYSGNGNTESTRLDEMEIATIRGYDEYNMQFKNTTLDKVFERIEKKFDVRISVENKSVTRCRLTADFTDRSLETTLNMLRDLLDLHYTVKENTVTISGSGCN